MKVEIWKDIESFSKYQVSNLGRIKSKGRYTKVGIKNQDKCYRKEYIVDGFINKNRNRTLRIDKMSLIKTVERRNKEIERLNNIIKDIKSQLDYLETYSSKEDVFEDMKRRLDRIESIIGSDK